MATNKIAQAYTGCWFETIYNNWWTKKTVALINALLEAWELAQIILYMIALCGV